MTKQDKIRKTRQDRTGQNEPEEDEEQSKTRQQTIIQHNTGSRSRTRLDKVRQDKT
jgi:hypothetical protein